MKLYRNIFETPRSERWIRYNSIIESYANCRFQSVFFDMIQQPRSIPVQAAQSDVVTFAFLLLGRPGNAFSTFSIAPRLGTKGDENRSSQRDKLCERFCCAVGRRKISEATAGGAKAACLSATPAGGHVFSLGEASPGEASRGEASRGAMSWRQSAGSCWLRPATPICEKPASLVAGRRPVEGAFSRVPGILRSRRHNRHGRL